jgi:uncharacterized protein DUF6582/Mu-like prophage I protein
MIAKRKDVSPTEGKTKYGDVEYADETNKKYPIDTEEHIRAAWNYISKEGNAAKYSPDDVKKIKAKIIAAWKAKIDKDGPPSAPDAKASSILITAQLTSPIDLVDEEPPGVIMFAPAGRHRIRPLVNGQPQEIDVEVDSNAVSILQADLTKRQQGKVRPIGAFDHKPGPASFIPKRFFWNDGEGVMLEVDWTGRGLRTIQGRDYSYFSPSFRWNEGKIVGLPEKGEIGSLTNAPAFEEIRRIAASETPPGDPQPHNGDPAGNNNNMSQLLTQAVALGLVTEGSDEVRASTQLVTSITALQKRAETAEAQVVEFKQKEKQALEVAATAAIDTAITEGRLPGKNDKIKTFWVKAMLEDPDGTREAISAMAPNPVLKQTIKPTVRDGQRSPVVNGISIEEQVRVKLAAIRAANPNLSLEDCYVILETQNPELIAASSVEVVRPA